MRVFVIHPEPGRYHFHDCENTLEALQGLVGGYIETGTPAELRDEGVYLICNEEGVLRGLPYNENTYPFFYAGTLVMVGADGENFTSLNQHQQDFVTYWIESLMNP